MDSSDILRMLSADHYAPADLEAIDDICRNYPMFNLAHILKVRIKEVLGHEKESELKVAAVYSSDRRRLHQLISEVEKPQVEEEPMVHDEPEGIQFSDEPHQEAEIIIEQHAPYAVAVSEGDLLELEDENAVEFFSIDEEPEADPESEEAEVEMSAETLIESLVKDETDMEEAEPEKLDIPIIDEVEPEKPNLIQSFLEEEPGPIRADKKTNLRGDVSLASIMEHDGFITDTLAKIYVKQGLYAKAIYAYEKLSLKYPEKSAYFAAQIEKIKNINHS